MTWARRNEANNSEKDGCLAFCLGMWHWQTWRVDKLREGLNYLVWSYSQRQMMRSLICHVTWHLQKMCAVCMQCTWYALTPHPFRQLATCVPKSCTQRRQSKCTFLSFCSLSLEGKLRHHSQTKPQKTDSFCVIKGSVWRQRGQLLSLEGCMITASGCSATGFTQPFSCAT